ncbi:MAG TPA: hypothetical protein VMS37_25555 [Verrucomicrobiae bacterium]|nr:hypothetical protein [Verrucomicrobiae bacterium]
MTVKERLDQHDRQIAAIRGLIHEGMRLVVQTRRDLRKLAEMQLATGAAQQKTEAKLQALIDSMRRGGNGHKGSRN